jgi:thiamine-monophosphate kinase
MTYEQVGARCACGAISDVVAMGAQPEVVVVVLALPGRTDSAAVRALYRGIDAVCLRMGCEVAGGDIIALDRLVLALTVTGRTTRPKLRSGAKPGDKLYVTGGLGAAEAGRLVLASRAGRPKDVPRWAEPLVERHLCPIPRLEGLKALGRKVRGMIDTSDGLSTDASHMAEMSRVSIVLEAERLPVAPGVKNVAEAQGLDPLSFVLSAGEDYELLFTSYRPIPSMVNDLPVTRIGRVERGSGLWVWRSGKVTRVLARGYDHLTSRTQIR